MRASQKVHIICYTLQLNETLHALLIHKIFLFHQEVQEPTSDLGEILVSLLYNENLHRLTVTVIEARGLKVSQNTTTWLLVIVLT